MLTKQLNFNFPSELVATQARARGESRIFLIPRSSFDFREISWPSFFDLFREGDVLVLNDTRVLKARLVMGSREVFFLRDLGERRWEVLTKGLRGRAGKEIALPGDLRARFVSPGLPAVIEILDAVDIPSYFDRFGHVPLPPYILALRESGSDEPEDVSRYQTVWAREMGSVAAPTASLHFGEEHLAELRRRGVDIQFVTLHVGAGTFLPLDVDRVEDFKIHSEWVSVSSSVVEAVTRARAKRRVSSEVGMRNATGSGGRVWACGTTVMRALETAALRSPGASSRADLLQPFEGQTDLFIKPGFDFRVVDGLLTNFHQPQSSLLLLAASFASKVATQTSENRADLENGAVAKILRAYEAAIAQKFRLFSYGDLTVII